MSGRLTNLLLLAAVIVLVASGLLGWILPDFQASPLYTVHRAVGVGLILALAWKQLIVRSSLGRRIRIGDWRSLVPGALAGITLALTLTLGVVWTAGLVSFDRPFDYSPLNVHVFAGVALLPLMLWHLSRRWESRPPLARMLTRRNALRVVGLGGISLLVGLAVERIADGRRITGSKHAGSFTGNAFPLTIWAFDSVPPLDARTWSLELAGRLARPGTLTYDQLAALPTVERDVIIDCTGGWWSEQRWSGVALAELLRERRTDAAARYVTVRSITGHAWTFLLDDLQDALLATHVGGEVLSAGHGYPVRLVVPGRRGLQWVKWVARIEVA